MSFQQSPVYKLIKASPFPLISRLQRKYEPSDPLIDLALVSRRAVFLSLAGYMIGQKLFTKGPAFFFAFGGGALAYQLGVDYQLRSEGKYQQLYVHGSDQADVKQRKQVKVVEVKNQRVHKKMYEFKKKPALRNLEVLTPEKLVDQLPKSYFI